MIPLGLALLIAAVVFVFTGSLYVAAIVFIAVALLGRLFGVPGRWRR